MLDGKASRLLFCEMVKEIWARKAYISALYDDQKSKMGIYQIQCLVDGRVYIGSAVNICRRWSSHRCALNKNNHCSRLLQRAWDEYGHKAFVWEILAYVYNPNMLLIVEDEYIKRLKSANPKFGFNVKPSSERASEETRKKISKSHIGKKHTEEAKQKMRDAKIEVSEETRQKIGEARLGKKHSEESRLKIGESSLGKKLSEETKQKIRNAQLKIRKETKRKLSEETKQKIREALLGKKHSEETKQRIRDSSLKMSEETKQRIRESAFGRKHSEETKLKMSEVRSTEEMKQRQRESHTGKKHSEETKQKMRNARIMRKMKNKVIDDPTQPN